MFSKLILFVWMSVILLAISTNAEINDGQNDCQNQHLSVIGSDCKRYGFCYHGQLMIFRCPDGIFKYEILI
jgi:hypothetical protein